VDRSVVTKHLQNIFSEGELDRDSTCAKIAQVQKEGQREVTRNVKFYNLDAIISVGYRVNSQRATHFRIWATQILKEYLIKGFAMNDERLDTAVKVIQYCLTRHFLAALPRFGFGSLRGFFSGSWSLAKL
jgi:hypothetical protein